MIDRLASAEEYDLLAISQVIGGLVFKKGDELEWFRKRFTMFQDILRESPFYQELVEQGLEKGKIQAQREILVSFVQRHFPEITTLAEQQGGSFSDSEALQTVLLKLLDAKTVEEARQILLGIDKGETRH